MNTSHAGDHPVTFLFAYFEPTLGMESVAKDLLEELPHSGQLRAVAVGGPAWASSGIATRSLGPRLTGARKVFSVWRLWRSRRMFQGSQVVLVGVWVAIPFLLLPGWRKRRCVVWEHSLMQEKIDSARGLQVLAKLARLVYKRADSVVCVSLPLTEDVRALTGHPNVVTIPNLIGPERRGPDDLATQRPDRDASHLVTVGSLTKTKQQAVVVEAMPLLDPATTLSIVGDGPERSAIEERVRQLRLGDRVTFHGHVEHSESVRLIGEGDLMVHPSAGETFGMVYFEAAQSDTPVLARQNRIAAAFIPEFVPGAMFTGGAAELAAAIIDRRAHPSEAETRSAFERRSHHLGRDAIVDQWSKQLNLRPHKVVDA